MPWSAAAVHLLTALGVVCALFAMLAALEADWQALFVWLGIALIVDGIDGPLARRVDVAGRLPRFSGERLDLVIDYLTYVFIPVIALLRSGALTGASGLVLSSAILLSALYHFADTESKSDDNSFVGFPAIWNVVTFYLLALGATGWLAVPVVATCVVLTFVPTRWVHPIRVVAFRPLTLAVATAWLGTAVAIIATGFPAAPWAQAVLLLAGLYLAAVPGLAAMARTRRDR